MSRPAALSPDDRRALLERVIATTAEVVASECGCSVDTIARAIIGRQLTTLASLAIREQLAKGRAA